MTEQVQQDAERMIKEGLRKSFPEVKFVAFETTTEKDEDGMDYLSMRVVYDEKGAEPGVRATSKFGVRIWHKLADAGLDVFPMISYTTGREYRERQAGTH